MPRRNSSSLDYAPAHRHLSRRDRVLKRLIKQLGPCTLRHDTDGFSVLARSIIAQQISTKAAASIAIRLIQSLGKLTPARVAAARQATLRSAGLSAAKTKALFDLARKVQAGEVPLRELPHLSDEEV